MLVSRVRLGKRLFVIGFDPKTQNEHLKKLKPSVALAVWEAGYDERGKWNDERARRFAAQLLASAKAGAGQRDRGKRLGLGAARRAGRANGSSTWKWHATQAGWFAP